MRPVVAASLLLGAAPLLQGCCLGAVSRFDGEGPIKRIEERKPLDEAVSGEGGALLRERGTRQFVALTPSGVARVEVGTSLDLAGAQIEKGVLYRLTKEGVVRAPLDDPAGGETIAHVPSARAVGVAGDTLVVACQGGVVLVRGASSRTIWQGEALAVTVDLRRKAAWIVGREPLAVVDVVGLEDDELLLRIPLPDALASPNVRVTLSGSNVAIWAHDRPLEEALLVAPERRAIWGLVEPEAGSSRDALAAATGRFVEGSPPLLVAPSGPAAKTPSFGRVAPGKDGRFLVASVSQNHSRGQLAWISAAATNEFKPTRASPAAPEKWTGVIAGVAWSEDEVVVAADAEHNLHVKPDGACELETPFDLGRSVRHGVNDVLNAPVAVVEIGLSLAGGVFFGSLAVPFSPLVFFLEPKAGLLCLVAPVWLPFVRF